uniref:Uncharacterized protein n=1 Tax=Octopus bimaculoides TaxID=37653 RepID=A0A0L8FI11_OCTBM
MCVEIHGVVNNLMEEVGLLVSGVTLSTYHMFSRNWCLKSDVLVIHYLTLRSGTHNFFKSDRLA